MSIIGNIIWIVFGGLFMALEYMIGGILLCLTIVGIPFGLQVIRIGLFALWPFGGEVRANECPVGCLNTLLNIVWIFIGGIWIALSHLVWGTLFCITIVGIPFGIQHFKLKPAVMVRSKQDRNSRNNQTDRQDESKSDQHIFPSAHRVSSIR